jgi:hypothetical protein
MMYMLLLLNPVWEAVKISQDQVVEFCLSTLCARIIGTAVAAGLFEMVE